MVHGDPVQRQLKAEGLTQVWLTDVPEHHTKEGKLYLCAVKDAFPNRSVGYSIDGMEEDQPGHQRATDGRATAW